MGLFNFNKVKEYRNAKKIANKVNKLLSDSKFLNDLISSNDAISISYEISKIIEYYILTNDNECNYTYEEFHEVYNSEDTYNLFQEFDKEAYRKNMILANSSNGYSKKNILKNGFKNINFDEKLKEELEYVENKLEKSRYIENQSKSNSQEDEYLYFTTPGSLVVEYSMKLSPERLYLGILKGINQTPYILGEGKINYCKRIIERKVKETHIENDEKINIYIEDILNKMCSKNPIINLFPEKTKNNQIKAWGSSISDEYNPQDLSEFIYDEFTEGYADFENGGSFGENSANLVTTNTNLRNKDIGIIDIPDWFECLEIKARSKGYKNGEMIDVNTFEKIERELSRNDEKQQEIIENNIQSLEYLPKTDNDYNIKDSSNNEMFNTQKIGKVTINISTENKDKIENVVVKKMKQKEQANEVEK